MKTVPLVGYSNKLSGRPGDSIEFMVSSEFDADYTAQLFRSISADPNPDGSGIVEQCCDMLFSKQSFPSRQQNFYPGSYGLTELGLQLEARHLVRFSVFIYPTLRCNNEQSILDYGRYGLALNTQGNVVLRADENTVTSTDTVQLRCWYRVEGLIEASGEISLTLERADGSQPISKALSHTGSEMKLRQTAQIIIAARLTSDSINFYFNGKIESPQIYEDDQALALWDFSHDISSMSVPGQSCSDLKLINAPTRAVTSALWDASEMNWLHKPNHYAAIAFHQDSIYDFNWKPDFGFVIPDNMPSGIYVMRIACGAHYDAMPFFVCPKLGRPTAKVCVLISTFTYSIYGNHARPDYEPSWLKRIADWNAYPNNPAVFSDYGLSTYNNHPDGSGICHASYKRPLFNLRPGYLTFGQAECSGLRHFQADSHLISWLHAKEISYDIVTDEELHDEGVNAINTYDAVITGSHPEYHTSETLDALAQYRDQGGALHYLGGNGFYWRIARHKDDPSLLEIRRAEDGLRAWASEPGEYYNAFDGAYGGLWRRSGRAPQQLVGIGFTAQGTFDGMPYHRVCYDKNFDWVFEGIDDDLIGDFGFSGNGAAGFELDRIDLKLDAGHDITILAQAYAIENKFILVPEEQLTHLTNLSGSPEEDVKRADMVYFETSGGGTVFSVGSITFCGSLPWNNFENNVSRLLLNVLSRSLGDLSS